MKRKYSLKLIMESYLNEEEEDSREIKSSRATTSFTYPSEVTEETSVYDISSKAIAGNDKGQLRKKHERTGDFLAKYYGKSKGKKDDLVKYRYEKIATKNVGGVMGKSDFLEGITFIFPNKYVINIHKNNLLPDKVAYTGIEGGKLKFRGKFDTKIKREFYEEIKKQDLIDFDGAPGEKDLFNRILMSLNGVFIDSQRDDAIAELEAQQDAINESSSRGSLYRKRYRRY